MMKYFFDIEKEITQQLMTNMAMRMEGCKELLQHMLQAIAHR